MSDSELPYSDDLPHPLQRIEACVNACEGYDTEFLERLGASKMPLPLSEADKPWGDTEAQARGWRIVWEKLVEMGLLRTLAFSNASDRALAFLDTLQPKEVSVDLLEACKQLAMRCNTLECCPGLVAKAKAAIAKAEGDVS